MVAPRIDFDFLKLFFNFVGMEEWKAPNIKYPINKTAISKGKANRIKENRIFELVTELQGVPTSKR